MKKKVIVVIPARYQSSRFPGKPLALIAEKPMIQWVYERVNAMSDICGVYVATDDERIYEVVEAFGGHAIMTGECECGTDRVYQASKGLDCDVIINIQGDEPLINTDMVQKLVEAFDDETVVMATLKKAISDDREKEDANVVKVITDCNNDAIYFSRHGIPYNRENKEDVVYYKHIGAYAYSKAFLEKYVSLPVSNLEQIEKLEQLRVIENGYKIRVLETEHQSIGVDIPEHIAYVEEQMKKEGLI